MIRARRCRRLWRQTDRAAAAALAAEAGVVAAAKAKAAPEALEE
jgi:hypothetical protein